MEDFLRMTVLNEEVIEEPIVEEQIQDTQADQKKESDEDRNWKAFLEKRKEETKAFEEEKEKNRQLEAEKLRRDKEIEDMKQAFSVLVEKKESNPYADEEEERTKIIQTEVSRQVKDFEERRHKKEQEEKFNREMVEIKNQMPDLMEICSQDNIAYLEYYHPEIAIPLAKMPDGFEKTKLAYQAIKKHVKMANKERDKIEQNLSKPKSVHSNFSNETQKEESSGHMSEKRRNEVYQKMQRLISGEDED